MKIDSVKNLISFKQVQSLNIADDNTENQYETTETSDYVGEKYPEYDSNTYIASPQKSNKQNNNPKIILGLITAASLGAAGIALYHNHSAQKKLEDATKKLLEKDKKLKDADDKIKKITEETDKKIKKAENKKTETKYKYITEYVSVPKIVTKIKKVKDTKLAEYAESLKAMNADLLMDLRSAINCIFKLKNENINLKIKVSNLEKENQKLKKVKIDNPPKPENEKTNSKENIFKRSYKKLRINWEIFKFSLRTRKGLDSYTPDLKDEAKKKTIQFKPKKPKTSPFTTWGWGWQTKTPKSEKKVKEIEETFKKKTDYKKQSESYILKPPTKKEHEKIQKELNEKLGVKKKNKEKTPQEKNKKSVIIEISDYIQNKIRIFVYGKKNN